MPYLNQFLLFLDKAKLNLILIAVIPEKKSIIFQILITVIFPNYERIEPIIKFNNAHKTLMKGEDKPFPGGFAKGVGNLLPETPLTKCGTVFVKKTPAKKHAI